MTPSPVVELNRAVAVAMADGPEAGLALVDALDASGALDGYHLLPATRADLLRRLGRHDEAAAAYRDALALATTDAERRYLHPPPRGAGSSRREGRSGTQPWPAVPAWCRRRATSWWWWRRRSRHLAALIGAAGWVRGHGLANLGRAGSGCRLRAGRAACEPMRDPREPMQRVQLLELGIGEASPVRSCCTTFDTVAVTPDCRAMAALNRLTVR